MAQMGMCTHSSLRQQIETCYLVKGRVREAKGGSSSSEFVEFGAGDIVRDHPQFPKGLSCTWDVSTAIDKHYKFESS